MAGNRFVPCPRCRAPLEVALDVQVEVRLVARTDGKYGIGAVHQTLGQIRARLERQHGTSDGSLYLAGEPDEHEERPEGEVVFCSKRCGFSGFVTDRGIEA